ncbi:MAG: hypothetical protein IPM24_25055 [Bryobacterales bacterium]|nr:hypothetical protein [Bryobacterales bacterium]
MIALRNGLVSYGPMSDDALLELVSPSTLGSKDMAKKTLSRWKQIGAFEVDDKGRTNLTPRIRHLPTADIDAFRTAILDFVQAPENSPALVDGQDDEQEASKASDLTRALCWALTQNPFTFPHVWSGVESLQNEQGVDPKVFVNDTRWGGFAEWSLFLGFCAASQRQGISLNPSFAVRVAAPRVIVSREVGVRDFVSGIARIYPVLDGGMYRTIVERQILRPWRTTQPHEISPSLSLALLTLEAEGFLHMELRSDAPSSVLTGRRGREVRIVSHILLGEGA